MKEIERFDAIDESGEVVRLVVYQRQVPLKNLLSNAVAGGLCEVRTEEGGPVNVRDDGTYFDLRGQRVLRRRGA